MAENFAVGDDVYFHRNPPAAGSLKGRVVGFRRYADKGDIPKGFLLRGPDTAPGETVILLEVLWNTPEGVTPDPSDTDHVPSDRLHKEPA